MSLHGDQKSISHFYIWHSIAVYFELNC